MPIYINTNTQAIFAQRALGSNTSSMQKSVEKLSTGFRINRAGDDAAGLSISEKLTAQIKGLEKAQQNIGDGISAIQTAEGALGVVQDNVQRIRELVVQSSNGTNGTKEKDAIQREINERISTIDSIAQATKFNGNSLLYGATNTFTLQTGADNSQTTTVTLTTGTAAGVNINVGSTAAGSIGESAGFELHALHVGGSVKAQDASTSSATSTPLSGLDTMLDNLSRMRSYLGAVQNSLESKSEYIGVAAENAAASRSRVKDVDVAKESSVMLRNQILQQSSASMLSQANQTPGLALSLLP